MTKQRQQSTCAIRPGLKDLWNSQLVKDAKWTKLDYPKVKTTAEKVPVAVISWHDAITQHNKLLKSGNADYHINAYLHCYIDDTKFDGEREGIWEKPERFYAIASHYDGILGIDFSTNADFPEPIKRNQFYKMRAMEYGANARNISLYANARWGTKETWKYCYDGLPKGQALCVGTVASGLRKLENRPVFEAGLRELVKLKHPPKLIIVGSASYEIFDELRRQGIEIIQFDGPTSCHFQKEDNDVEAS